MAYNVLSCVENLGNTGLANCKDDLGYDAMLLWTTDSFEFASEADAQDQDKYEEAINAGTMFPMPQFDEIEPALEDDVKQELATGIKLFVREGKYGGIGRFEGALCTLSNLRTFNRVKGRAFIVTSEGNIFGTSPDGVKFRGFKLSEFNVGKLGSTDGSTKRMIPIAYQFKNPTEMGDYPAVPTLTWDGLDLAGVIDVNLTGSGTAVAGLVIVSVARKCDSEVVTGLVEADFTLLNAAASEQLPADTFADNADGTYSFTFSTPLAADSYTLNLKTPAAQTTGGYESTAAISFTIT